MAAGEGALLRFQNVPGRIGSRKVERIVRRMESAQPIAIGYAEGRHMGQEFARDSKYDQVSWMDKATPTLVRPDVRVSGTREQVAYPPTPVGRWGAGPSTLAAGIPHVLRLEPPEVEPLWFGNGHLVPSVTRKAQTEYEKDAREKRRRLHRAEIVEWVDLTEGLDRVVLVADWNCPPTYTDVGLLRRAGFRIVTMGKTHVGGGEIDWFAVRGVHVVGKRRLARLGSDHYGVEIRVR